MELNPEVFGLDSGGFLTRLAIDLTCVFVLIRVIYYRSHRRADLFLTFFLFNLSIFLITFLMNRVEMTLGAAFGLFAVFSMLRYRTEGIATTDMTYLFLVIALGLITAVSDVGPIELALLAGLVLACTSVLESSLFRKRELTQDVLYDKIELINTEARRELIGDLRRRTGLNIHRVRVRQIDLLRDAAQLTVYYYPLSKVRHHVAEDDHWPGADDSPIRGRARAGAD